MDKIYTDISKLNVLYLDTTSLFKAGFVEPPGDNAVRVAVYLPHNKRCYSSLIGIGEFISVSIRKHRKQMTMTHEDYLFGFRALLMDVGNGKIKLVEPPAERAEFILLMKRLQGTYPKLEPGDLWHLMAALELRKSTPSIGFISSDRKLLKAARAEGFLPINPDYIDPGRFSKALSTK